MPYTYTLISPTPAYVSINNSTGEGVVDLTQAPAAGASEVIRVEATDGAATETIDLLLTVLASPIYGVNYTFETLTETLMTLSVESEVAGATIETETTLTLSVESEVDPATATPTGDGLFDMPSELITNPLIQGTPAAAGTNLENKHTFGSVNYVNAFPDTRLTEAGTGSRYGGTLKRSEVWVYQAGIFGGGAWESGCIGHIDFQVTDIDGAAPNANPPANPGDLGIVPSFVNQVCRMWFVDAGGGAEGYVNYYAMQQSIVTSIPVAGVANTYWAWLSDANQY